jgi:hypothetical protein
MAALNFVLDGPPGPDMPRLVEVEDDDGRGITVGEWKGLRGDYWTLRITEADLDKPVRR